MMSNLHTVSIEWVFQKGIIIIGQKVNIEPDSVHGWIGIKHVLQPDYGQGSSSVDILMISLSACYSFLDKLGNLIS